MNKRVISIEAGVWWTKVALVDYRKKNPPVHAAFAFPTPEHAVEDGYIRDKDRFAAALCEELGKHNIHEKSVVFTLSSSKVVTREVTIPYVKDNKIESIINAQIRDYFPMDVSSYTISYNKMDIIEEDGKKQLKLLLIAIPDNLLGNYCSFAEIAGLKTETFDYIGNGTVQLLGDALLGDSVVVQLEEQATVISILEGKKLVFQRVTPYGYGATLSAITEHPALGIENEYDAFDYLLQHDVLFEQPKENADEMQRALLEEAYEDLAESLRYHLRIANTAVEYYQNQVKREFTGSICLVGDGSRFQGMTRLFSEGAPLELAQIDYARVIDLKNDKSGKKAKAMEAKPGAPLPKAATPTGFLSVIGAAVHPIDARPKDMQEADSKKTDLRTAKLVLLGALLLSLVLILTGSIRQLLATAEHNRLTARIDELSYVQETYDEQSRVQQEEQVYEAFDAATVTKNEQLLPLVEQLEEVLPTGVSVDSISADDSLVTINMKADEKVTVGQMLLNFADVTLLTDVSIPSMTENEDESGNVTSWTYTVSAYYTDALLVEETEETNE